jgi:hypothetical protein
MPDQENDTTPIGETEETTHLGSEDTSFLGAWEQQPETPGTAESAAENPQRRGGFHPLQTGYLVVGVLASGAALLWLLMDQGVVEVGDGGVAWSVVLITAGAVGLIASLGRALRRN